MNELWIIACGCGIRDGLNPCILMTCAVFMAYGFWFKENAGGMGWLRIVFVLIYTLGILVFNFGPGQVLVFNKNFIFATKIIYFILGGWAFVLGVLFFKDWFLIRRGLVTQVSGEEKIKPFVVGPLVSCLTAIVLGLALSALATFWPIDVYIMLLGNEAFLKGQWPMAMPVLAGYVLAGMWPLWFVWAFLSVKNLSPSLLKIVCAAIFFTASSCLVFVFK